VGKDDRAGKEEKVKSTVVKPSNGQASKRKVRPHNRAGFSGFSLRRLTKRQRERLSRILVTIFLLIFVLVIAGGLLIVTTQPVPTH
jgi:hypothetical protein